MQTSEIVTLYEYNEWANTRVMEAAEKVDPSLFTARAITSHGSLRGTLVHILTAEWLWRVRCQEGFSPTELLEVDDFPTLEALRARWETETQAWRAYLSAVQDQDLERSIHFTTTRGVPFENILWQLLVHVVNHGTQFRGEAAMLLTEYGSSPGDLDFIDFLRG
jgi:uncharacterized damage-inducible protein DinB